MGYSRASCVCGRRTAELNCRIREERNHQTLIQIHEPIGLDVVQQADAAAARRTSSERKSAFSPWPPINAFKRSRVRSDAGILSIGVLLRQTINSIVSD